MEEKNLFYATFSPALMVEYKGQMLPMHHTLKYNSLAELLSSCAKFAEHIHDVKMTIVRESADHKVHAYL